MILKEYCFGVYYYVDTLTGKIDYIGLDSHIDMGKRKQAHLMKSRRNKQPFNRVLQNNPERWEYYVGAILPDYETTRQLEKDLIAYHSPRFNFKDGGEGWINPHFEYRVSKAGIDTYTQKQKYGIRSRLSHDFLIVSFDKSKLETLSDKLNAELLSELDVKKRTYNVCKSGRTGHGTQRYGIYQTANDSRNFLIRSTDIELVKKARDMLNNDLITPNELKEMSIKEFKELI